METVSLLVALLGLVLSLGGAAWLWFGLDPESERYQADGMLHPGVQRSKVLPRYIADSRRPTLLVVLGGALQVVDMQTSAAAHEKRVAREEFGTALTMQVMFDFERRRNGPNRLTDRPSDETVLLLGARTADPSRDVLLSLIESILFVNPFARGDDRSGIPEFAIRSIRRAISEWVENPGSLPAAGETLSVAFTARQDWEQERDEMSYRMKAAESEWASRVSDATESAVKAGDSSEEPPVTLPDESPAASSHGT